MSDSEDDYMSDKLLVGCEKEDIRPGLLFNKSLKRNHQIYKNQLETKSKKPKSYLEREKETREKGLNTALPSNNVGFKLLQKMGFVNGSGLGKSIKGITEPIQIKVKSDSSGVGRDRHIQEVIRTKISSKAKVLEDKQKEFIMTNAEKRVLMTLQKDFMKSQRICEQLDFKANVKEPNFPFFWTKTTRDMLKQKKIKKHESDEESSEEEESDDEESVINETSLKDIILYLRTKYKYCIFCGDFVEEDDESCPGYFRSDHDD